MDNRVYYSYNTAVGVETPNNDLFISENVWSTTTGRHLTWIDGGSREAKESRMRYKDFIELLESKNIDKYYN